jgi:hypothetical protein
MRTSTLALTLLALSVAADAQTKECEANFHRSGGLLSGTTYKTVASIPGTTAAEALSRVHAFTAESGFAVTSIDRASGVIAAVNSGSTSNRPYNLNIVIADVPGSEARITLTTLCEITFARRLSRLAAALRRWGFPPRLARKQRSRLFPASQRRLGLLKHLPRKQSI